MALLIWLTLLAPAAAAPSSPPVHAPAPPPEPAAVAGLYRAKGEVAGKKYQTVVAIRKVETLYLIRWMNGASGIGFRDGASLVFGFQTSGGGMGAARYRIELLGDSGKPRLVGRWTTNPGSGEVNGETLSWLAPLEEDD